jgi:catechol 2,3-dioxygenase-like lactoylglutathione lyase family enzyme
VLKRLDNIGLAVSNARRSLEFYIEKLGFEGEVTEGEGSAHLGDMSLYIFESKAGTKGAVRTTDYYQNPVGIDHLSFEVEDIIREGKALESRGIVFDQNVVGEPGSFRYRGFRDPDGNMVYIIQKG